MSLKKYLSEAEVAAIQPVTGDAFDINIREITNIESVVLEHGENSVLIQLDETAINLLEEAGCTFEDAQLDELAPFVSALARGAVAGAGKLARGAAKVAVGTGVKAAADKLDKKLFGPKPGEEYEYEESVAEQDDEEIEYSPQVGDIVQIVYETNHEGHYGEVVELSPSGDFVYVQFKDGDIESYHASDLRQATEDEEEEYYYGNDDEFKEGLNSIRKLSGMSESDHDKSSMGPYDRGAADSYYGRPFKPHKFVDNPGGVQGERKRVELTDPEEIAAYEAGYKENDDEKDYGKFPDYSDDDMKEAAELRRLSGLPEAKKDDAGLANWDMNVTSIPRTEPFKLKNIVVKSPGGKTYTFDTEEDARRLFLDKWHFVKDPKSGWKVDMNNTKPTDESAKVDEAEYQGRNVPLGKPMQGDVKKFKVYVKDPSTGNVKKVNFGDPNMRIKKSNPERRKNFRARHNCDNPGPRTKARYWSCRKW